MKTIAKQENDAWSVEGIAEQVKMLMARSHDGIARIDLPPFKDNPKLKIVLKKCHKLITEKGGIFKIYRIKKPHIAALKHEVDKLRLCVFPPGYKPPRPIESIPCDNESKANNLFVQSVIAHPRAYVKTLPLSKPVVEVWDFSSYVQMRYPALWPCEAYRLFDHAIVEVVKLAPMRLSARQRAGAKATANKGKANAKIIRAEYLILRKEYGSDVKKEWLQRKIAMRHPRKRGFKLRSIKAHTKDLK